MRKKTFRGGAPIQNASLKLNDEGMMNTTVMSMEEVMSRDGMMTMSSMGTEDEVDDRLMTKCVHKRGKCVTHKINGKKIIVKH